MPRWRPGRPRKSVRRRRRQSPRTAGPSGAPDSSRVWRGRRRAVRRATGSALCASRTARKRRSFVPPMNTRPVRSRGPAEAWRAGPGDPASRELRRIAKRDLPDDLPRRQIDRVQPAPGRLPDTEAGADPRTARMRPTSAVASVASARGTMCPTAPTSFVFTKRYPGRGSTGRPTTSHRRACRETTT